MPQTNELNDTELIYPDCAACEGTGKRFNQEEDWYDECEKCSGEGWIQVEVCKGCRVSVDEDCVCVEVETEIEEAEMIGA